MGDPVTPGGGGGGGPSSDDTTFRGDGGGTISSTFEETGSSGSEDDGAISPTTPGSGADRDRELLDLPGATRYGPGTGPSGTGSGTETGTGEVIPPEETASEDEVESEPPDYSDAASENKYILDGEEVQIIDILNDESFLFIDAENEDGELNAFVAPINKFYFVYGLLIDMDVSSDTPRYVFRLYENYADLELEIGVYLNTPPEQFKPSNGLFQDMTQFDNDVIIAGRFERRIDNDGTESYDQEYLMFDKTSKKLDTLAASLGHGGGLWLSPESRFLFNYRFNVTEQGAQKILTSCIDSIKDNFKIARSQNTSYDFKFCETQRPEISGEQVITTEASTTPTTTTPTGGGATTGGGSTSGGY